MHCLVGAIGVPFLCALFFHYLRRPPWARWGVLSSLWRSGPRLFQIDEEDELAMVAFARVHFLFVFLSMRFALLAPLMGARREWRRIKEKA